MHFQCDGEKVVKVVITEGTGTAGASIPSGIKRQIPPEALSRWRKDRKTTVSGYYGCSKGKSSLTDWSPFADERIGGCVDKKKSSGQHLPLARSP